jgi:hypothetical protein
MSDVVQIICIPPGKDDLCLRTGWQMLHFAVTMVSQNKPYFNSTVNIDVKVRRQLVGASGTKVH